VLGSTLALTSAQSARAAYPPKVEKGADGNAYIHQNGQTAQFVTIKGLYQALAAHPEAMGAYWVKPQPWLFYLLPKDASQVPDFIKKAMLSGGIDNLYWGMNTPDRQRSFEDFVKQRAGEPLILQVTGDKKDFYVVGNYSSAYLQFDSLDEALSEMNHEDVYKDHSDILELVKSRPSKLVAAKKVVKVLLVRLSELGFDVAKRIAVDKPDSGMIQIAEPNEDAYIKFEITSTTAKAYLVNTEKVAITAAPMPWHDQKRIRIVKRPIAYVPLKEVEAMRSYQKNNEKLPIPDFLVREGRRAGAHSFGVYPEENSVSVLPVVIEEVVRLETKLAEKLANTVDSKLVIQHQAVSHMLGILKGSCGEIIGQGK